ncbi:hypothetical protein ACFVVM_03720 [Nocardia sp. NPDC058176]|uniref:hypothetical protein n=1 Tax=Nocardia sp. NPDC058176 TaxID=3346368 RepID=UPI0036DA1CD5
MAGVEAGGAAAMSTEHGQEPVHDPIDLLDELDSIIRAQEVLRQRTIALQARYAALEPVADRFYQPNPNPRLSDFPQEYGSINVAHTAERLGHAAHDMGLTTKYALSPAREVAEKVREYPQPERSVARPEVDRRRSR